MCTDSIFNDVDFPNNVAMLCYDHFNKIVKLKFKDNNEWTSMAAIIKIDENRPKSNIFDIVAMGSGTKCVGLKDLTGNGDILHDSHAEIIARRAFVRYLYDEMHSLYTKRQSDVLDLVPSTNLCYVKRKVKFLIFITDTPCGDASIIPKTFHGIKSNLEFQVEDKKKTNEIYISHDVDEMPSDIYRTGAKCLFGCQNDLKLPGIDYHIVGVLRTKPGRGSPTLSMSCSDKIAKWIILGLQGSLLSYFMSEPIYLSAIVIGKCPYSSKVMKRALWERFSYDKDFVKCFPLLLQSDLSFMYGKIEKKKKFNSRCFSSPLGVIWFKGLQNSAQIVVNGYKQGATSSELSYNKQVCICRKKLFLQFVSLIQSVNNEDLPSTVVAFKNDIHKMSYEYVKHCSPWYNNLWGKVQKDIFKKWTEKPKISNFRAIN